MRSASMIWRMKFECEASSCFLGEGADMALTGNRAIARERHVRTLSQEAGGSLALELHPPDHRSRSHGGQVRDAEVERQARLGALASPGSARPGEDPHPLPAGAQRLSALRA